MTWFEKLQEAVKISAQHWGLAAWSLSWKFPEFDKTTFSVTDDKFIFMLFLQGPASYNFEETITTLRYMFHIKGTQKLEYNLELLISKSNELNGYMTDWVSGLSRVQFGL